MLFPLPVSSSRNLRDRHSFEGKHFREGVIREAIVLSQNANCSDNQFISFGLPRISSLLNTSCPSAIARFVVAIIVDAIERIFGTRMVAHILNKISNRQSPAFTNRNAATSVIFPAFIIRIIAAAFHVLPSTINARRFSPADSKTMFLIGFGYRFSLRHGRGPFAIGIVGGVP